MRERLVVWATALCFFMTSLSVMTGYRIFVYAQQPSLNVERRQGSGVPAMNCVQGESYFEINPAVAGYNLWLCTTTNTWTRTATPGLAPGVGASLASSATITPTNQIHHVTGTATVSTIATTNVSVGNTLILIPDGLFITDTVGNISLASAAVVNKILVMTWDGTKWNPVY